MACGLIEVAENCLMAPKHDSAANKQSQRQTVNCQRGRNLDFWINYFRASSWTKAVGGATLSSPVSFTTAEEDRAPWWCHQKVQVNFWVPTFLSNVTFMFVLSVSWERRRHHSWGAEDYCGSSGVLVTRFLNLTLCSLNLFLLRFFIRPLFHLTRV